MCRIRPTCMAWRNHWGQLHWPTCIARIILASLFTTNPFHFFNQACQPVSHGYVSQSGYSVLHGYNNISAGAWVARVDSIIVKLGGPCGTVSSTEWAAPPAVVGAAGAGVAVGTVVAGAE